MIFDYTKTYEDKIHIIAGQAASGKTRALVDCIDVDAYNVMIDPEGGIMQHIRVKGLEDLKGAYYCPDIKEPWLDALIKDIPYILEKSNNTKRILFIDRYLNEDIPSDIIGIFDEIYITMQTKRYDFSRKNTCMVDAIDISNCPNKGKTLYSKEQIYRGTICNISKNEAPYNLCECNGNCKYKQEQRRLPKAYRGNK